VSDSSGIPAAISELLGSVNEALREYFDVRRQRAENALAQQKEQDVLTAKYSELDKPLAEREAELGAKLRELLVPNKAMLLTGKLRSFKTTFGIVSYKQKAETTKVVDVNGLRKQARKDGKLTTLGEFTRTWKPKKIKDIQAWLKANPKLAAKYLPFLESSGGFDELFVKPDTAYFTEYDTNRLTNESVNLGRADDAEDDKSPDA
jgi:phage host-nuclease inhibitor protein Gam